MVNQTNSSLDKLSFFPKGEEAIPRFVSEHKLTLSLGAVASAFLFSHCKSLRSYVWMIGLPVGISLGIGAYLYHRVCKLAVFQDEETTQKIRKQSRQAIEWIGLIGGSILSGISGKYFLKGCIQLISGIDTKNTYKMLKGFEGLILTCGILLPIAHTFFLKLDEMNNMDADKMYEKKEEVLRNMRSRWTTFKSNPVAFLRSNLALPSNERASSPLEAALTQSKQQRTRIQQFKSWIALDKCFMIALAALQIKHQPVYTAAGVGLGIFMQQMAYRSRFAGYGVDLMDKSKQLAKRIFFIKNDDNSISGYSKRMYLSLVATTFIMRNEPVAPAIAGLFYSRVINSFLSKN